MLNPLTRRSVLMGSAAATALLIAGCASDNDEAAVDVDGANLDASLTSESALVAKYEAALRKYPDLTGELAPFLTNHREHVAALTSAGANPGDASSTQPTTPNLKAATVAALKTAEAAHGATCAASALQTSPRIARLLGSVSACEAAHVALLQDLA